MQHSFNFTLFNPSTLEREEHVFSLKRPEPAELVVPVIVSEEPNFDAENGTIRGISTGTARALLRAGMHYFSMAMEVFSDLPKWKESVSDRPTYIKALVENSDMSKDMARRAFDEMSGKVEDDAPARKQALAEFLAKTSQVNISNYERVKIAKNSKKVSKRGRKGEGRPEKLVYIPSEEELKGILQVFGFISPGLVDIKRSLTQGEFSEWPLKPREVFRSTVAYKDFITGELVRKHGKGDYSRKQIAEPVGRSIRTARKACERTGIRVTTNPPRIVAYLNDDNFRELLPTQAELSKWIAENRITEAHHIKSSIIDNKQYPPTQEAYPKAKKASKTGKVRLAVHQASTYDPGTSPYYGMV